MEWESDFFVIYGKITFQMKIALNDYVINIQKNILVFNWFVREKKFEALFHRDLIFASKFSNMSVINTPLSISFFLSPIPSFSLSSFSSF